MKKLLTLLALICVKLCGYSQPFHVTLSPPLRTDSYFNSFMPAGNGFVSATTTSTVRHPPIYYRLRLDRFGLALKKYDASLQVLKTNPVAAGDRVFGPFPPTLRYLGDKLCLIYYQLTFDNENSALAIFVAPIDTATLELVHPVQLFGYHHRNYGMIHALLTIGAHPPMFNSSPDGSRIIACWSTGSDSAIRVHVLDKDIRSLWAKKQVPAHSTSIRLLDGCIDDAGTVYLSYQAEPDSKHTTGHVLVLRENVPAMDNLIPVPGGQPFEVRLAPAPGQPFIHIIGTYTFKKSFLGGFFSTRINSTNFSLDSVKSIPVPDTLRNELKKDGWASTERGTPVLMPIHLQAYGFLGDRVELIGEFNAEDQNSEGGQITYTSGDILWVRLDQGKWSFHRIPKVHISSDPNDGVAVHPLKCTDRMLVFYDDAETNLRQDPEKRPALPDDAGKLVLACARLTPAGEIKREVVIDLSADHYLSVMDLLATTPHGPFLAMFNRVHVKLGDTRDYRLATVSVE